MQTENQTSKPDPVAKQETGEGCPEATCSASSDTPETDEQVKDVDRYKLPLTLVRAEFSKNLERSRNRLAELVADYERDKRQIGKDLGLPENERMHHRFQRRIICDLQRENRMMRMALEKVHERMQGPANNRRFMQIAGPARECLNLAKPFLPNYSGLASATQDSAT